MKQFSAALLAVLVLAFPAEAKGFKEKDFTKIAVDEAGYVAHDYAVKAQKERIIIACLGCAPPPLIDVRLGRSTDGTEQRYRSGETTIAKMEALCRERSPTCKLNAVEVGGGVGWVTSYPLGAGAGSTTILYQDSDMLTIRSIASDAKTAIENGRIARDNIATQIVGN